MIRTLLYTLAISLVVGCASSGPTVSSNKDPSANFAGIQTFGFMNPLGTDRSGARTPLSQMLANSVIKELEMRGMRQSETPDVAINFFVNTEQRMDVRQVPTSGFHRYRHGRYRTWGGYETRVREFTQGTLALDIVDPQRGVMIWEGTAVGRLGRGNIEITQEQVDDVVAAVLKEFPR